MARGRKKKYQIQEEENKEFEIKEEMVEEKNKSEEMYLTLNDIVGENGKVVLYRKHIKDFVEKEIGDSFVLFEAEMLLVEIPFNARAVELAPMYKLELNIEKYDGNKYLINPKNKTTKVVINPNSKFVKIVV